MKFKNFFISSVSPVWCFIALLSMIAATPVNAQGSDYPNRPITLITPFPAAGSTDLIARTIAQKLGEILGKPVIVENHAGAGGNIGSLSLIHI
jgi:tripartite-type tricarboxylate transporter receptor subunit TctC